MDCGFVAGTLVHTDKGLVPIEQIKVGDMVQSRHESGEGELTYKLVTKNFCTENQTLRGVVIAGSPDAKGSHIEEFLLTTANHSFRQVDDQREKGKWVAVSDLEYGDSLLAVSKSVITILENLPIYKTLDSDKVFYMVSPDSYEGIFLNISEYKNNNLIVPDYLVDLSLEVQNLDGDENFIEDEFVCNVYSLEVENFHTYFVGEIGVWVNNTCNSSKN